LSWMPTELWIAVIPALIALGGTVLTLIVTGRRQRQKDRNDGKHKYQDARQEAYGLLWEKLEEVHMVMRTDSAPLEKYNDAVREINTYISQKAILLDDEDQKLANQYMYVLRQVTQLVEKYAADIPQLKYGWEITAPINMGLIQEFQTEEQKIVVRMNSIRKNILAKCKAIVANDIV
jgi:hypothetical protein